MALTLKQNADNSLTITGSKNLGRNGNSKTLKITSIYNNAVSRNITVNQAACNLFVTTDENNLIGGDSNPAPLESSVISQTLTNKYYSNASALRFTPVNFGSTSVPYFAYSLNGTTKVFKNEKNEVYSNVGIAGIRINGITEDYIPMPSIQGYEQLAPYTGGEISIPNNLGETGDYYFHLEVVAPQSNDDVPIYSEWTIEPKEITGKSIYTSGGKTSKLKVVFLQSGLSIAITVKDSNDNIISSNSISISQAGESKTIKIAVPGGFSYTFN